MEFLDNIFLDNTIRNYLIVFAVIAFVLLFRKLISDYFANLLFFLIQRIWKNIEIKHFKKLIVGPLSWLIVIVVSVLAIDRLNYPEAFRFDIYGYQLQQLVKKLGICIIIISLIKFVLSFVDFISLILEHKASGTNDKSDDQLIVFFRDFLKVLIALAGILLLIKVGFNQNIGSLLTGLSIVGAALALAAKESIENIIASFIIFFDKPFYMGDTLKVNNVTGTVERIGLRSTRIRTPEKTLVTVPNKQMVDNIVDNYSMRSERRGDIRLELSVKTPGVNLDELIKKLKSRIDQNKNEIINYTVLVTEYNRNVLIITIEYFTIPFSIAEFNTLRHSLILSFKELIDGLEMEMGTGGEIVLNPLNQEPVPPPSKTII